MSRAPDGTRGQETGRSPTSPKRHNIAGAALILMVSLVLSRLTGYFRQMLIPARFGLGDLSDAYFLGFQIPDLMFQLLVGGSILAALTPFLSGSIERGEEEKGWRSVSIFMNYTLLLMGAAVVVGEGTVGWLLPLIAGPRSALVVTLSTQVARVLFPSVVFIMLAGLCIGILNSYRRFSASAWGPTFYNLGCMAALLLLGRPDTSAVVKVSGGILLSAAAYFLLQFFLARREFAHYVPSFDAKDPGFRRIVRTAVPTVFSASIVQVNLIVLSAFAARYASGAVSAMNLAITIWQLPYGVFAVAVGSAMLPSLSAKFAAGESGEFRRMLTASLRGALFLTIPSAVAILLLREDLIRALFQWNTLMSHDSVAMTAGVLAFYCIAIVSHTFVFLLNMTFYSMGKTRIPLLAGLISLGSNLVLCFFFTAATHLGVAGMALAYSISSVLSAVFLFVRLKRRHPKNAPRSLTPFLVKSGLAALVSAGVLFLVDLLPFAPAGKVGQFLWIGARLAVAAGVYLGLAAALGMPEFHGSLDRIRRRFAGKSQEIRTD
jgi:putative peptidoglycan lipid II flippase